MRISGLSERNPKPITAAIFKKGDVKGENRPGKNLPYFRLDWSEDWQDRYISINPTAIERYTRVYQMLRGRMPHESFMDFLQQTNSTTAPALFASMYGNQPKTVIVTNVEFDASMAKFGGNALLWRCDGQNIRIHWTDKGYSHSPQPCKAPNGVLDACKDENNCNYSGELRFQVPEYSALCGRIIHFALYTKSPNEIAAMSDIIDNIKSRTDINAVPFELYRYADTFTIPIKGVPSRTEQHMVGIMPFAIDSLNQIESGAKQQLAQNETPLLESGDSEDESPQGDDDALVSWLDKMSVMLSYTPFTSVNDFLTALYESREDATDINTIIPLIYKQWQDGRQNEVLERIFHGLAEMQSVIQVDSLYVYPFKKGNKDSLRYEIHLPLGNIAVWSLDEFRSAGYQDIDLCKMSPIEFMKHTQLDVEDIDGAIFYLDDTRASWRFSFEYLESPQYDENENAYIPITLKRHTTKNGKVEIQLGAVLSATQQDVLF